MGRDCGSKAVFVICPRGCRVRLFSVEMALRSHNHRTTAGVGRRGGDRSRDARQAGKRRNVTRSGAVKRLSGLAARDIDAWPISLDNKKICDATAGPVQSFHHNPSQPLQGSLPINRMIPEASRTDKVPSLPLKVIHETNAMPEAWMPSEARNDGRDYAHDASHLGYS